MTIELKIADEKDAEEWNRIVESSPHMKDRQKFKVS